MTRYRALATDYDGTIATNGKVDQPTIAALHRFARSGRQLLLVTGRQLDELLAILPEVHLFERVIAENGALVYDPSTGREKLLGEPPSPAFAAALKRRGVDRLSLGRVIVASWTEYEVAIRETVRDLGLDLKVILNKDAVMVLPRGVNKEAGLRVTLRELGMSPGDVVGVGDAENDVAFLGLCGYSAAVANALPMVKARVDLVTLGDHGAGVVELVDWLLASDPASRRGFDSTPG